MPLVLIHFCLKFNSYPDFSLLSSQLINVFLCITRNENKMSTISIFTPNAFGTSKEFKLSFDQDNDPLHVM
ncbi:uncharacterized protein PHALS_15316 [Plasmopara halstedii]|uniref:Uncharacterized protein n=1 Tax=Plasmopara halstedii TaxID=4781 RepID=A0A0P1AC82_PLAHL|nr:uncharacterized protein PHALS_15316 [Plasmopara halstedii]CEG38503.1 hypothetical protein PHALS_15316 [Plasmopara halstedii]|eukprot:XP_024574872.1 hypothetical protein PHALS_15316 [Plasmopara halstedii]